MSAFGVYACLWWLLSVHNSVIVCFTMNCAQHTHSLSCIFMSCRSVRHFMSVNFISCIFSAPALATLAYLCFGQVGLLFHADWSYCNKEIRFVCKINITNPATNGDHVAGCFSAIHLCEFERDAPHSAAEWSNKLESSAAATTSARQLRSWLI